MKQNLIIQATLLALTTVVSHAQTKTYSDVIFVNTDNMPSSQRSATLKPFLMEIFETSGAEAVALVPGISYNRTKPGRMTLDQAKEVCTKKGMRLPTKDEWMAAASNLGANRRYTLRNDTINDAALYTKVNISTGDSLVTTDINIGIDAIGALGMTGNRAEYFLNADGTSGECGGKYETQSISDVELTRICAAPTDNAATARCVVTYSSATLSNLTARVSGPLKDYINSLSAVRPTPVPATPTVPTPPVAPSKPVEPDFDDEF